MSHPNLMLKVVEITSETADSITIHLEHPEKKIIPYKAGQFLTLIVPINGKKERRAYSLCSSPTEQPRLSVTVKRVAGGLISNYLLTKLKVGDTLEVLEPLGNFCLCPEANNTRAVVLVGAGSGITPLLSIAKTVLTEEKKSRVLLIYGNRYENSVIFKNQLQELIQIYPGRLLVEYIYSQPAAALATTDQKPEGLWRKLFGKSKEPEPVVEPDNRATHAYTGRLNRSMVIKILEKHNLIDFLDTQYYMCGPEGMMEEVKEALRILHVPATQIFKESFVSSGHNAATAGTNGQVADNQIEGEFRDRVVTIHYEGTEYTLEVSGSETILEAALNKDIDLPFSCQSGLCTACRGKCLSGKVYLDEREGLSDAEMNEGYVLTCVGHPVTDNVVIEIG